MGFEPTQPLVTHAAQRPFSRTADEEAPHEEGENPSPTAASRHHLGGKRGIRIGTFQHHRATTGTRSNGLPASPLSCRLPRAFRASAIYYSFAFVTIKIHRLYLMSATSGSSGFYRVPGCPKPLERASLPTAAGPNRHPHPHLQAYTKPHSQRRRARPGRPEGLSSPRQPASPLPSTRLPGLHGRFLQGAQVLRTRPPRLGTRGGPGRGRAGAPQGQGSAGARLRLAQSLLGVRTWCREMLRAQHVPRPFLREGAPSWEPPVLHGNSGQEDF